MFRARRRSKGEYPRRRGEDNSTLKQQQEQQQHEAVQMGTQIGLQLIVSG